LARAAGGGGLANGKTSNLRFSYRGSPLEKRRRTVIPTNPSKLIAANRSELGSGTDVSRYPTDEMTAQSVSTLVNNPKNENPACIEDA
jgi:hypothetical protein